MKISAIAALAALAFAATGLAQDMPVPKIFRGLEQEKGQYQVEILEGAAKVRAPKMTICSDNLLKSLSDREKRRADRGCSHRLLKDTADEAVMESTCDERKSVVTMKREGKSILMDITSTGPRGPQTMKMRYTHLGPCSEGQGALTFDRDSEQCKKMKEAAAKMDPAKQCASQKSDREACEQRIRDTAAQLSAMCS